MRLHCNSNTADGDVIEFLRLHSGNHCLKSQVLADDAGIPIHFLSCLKCNIFQRPCMASEDDIRNLIR